VSFDLRNPETWIPRDYFAAYCGTRATKPLEHYERWVQKKKISPRLDLLAFFAFPIWAGLHKQWILWASWMTVVLASVFADEYFNIPSSAFSIGISVGFGMIATMQLFLSATGKYERAKSTGLNHEQILEKFRGQAQGTWWLAIGLTLASFVLVILFDLLLSMTIIRP
jgi:hypothetical protein